MVFVSLRKAFLTLMFVLGAAALLVGYSGWSWGLAPQDKAINTGATGSPRSPAEVNTLSEPASGEASSPTAQVRENFFVNYRLDREKSRGRQVEILKEIVENPSSAADIRKTAQEQLMEISSSITREVKVENILRARGYKDAVACVDKKGVTVIIDSPSISHSEEASILDMVSKETGYGEQGIVIIPRKNQ